ncbi:reverse transcriptase family protein [Calycomorphotria hydatis]|uniref:RNA-directed DNA polymerase n=1 Tax=Calycomorphotria hydatis TaxID=2528027 RepID=A0A517TAC2_9PLAN|nr:reverse transcriptase family protein [Calycomorphotria hydatis]QDT65313.1 Reverse transcriptase (RNA-dependent DNA polymerase) [Calycomorphotria hydatis]
MLRWLFSLLFGSRDDGGRPAPAQRRKRPKYWRIGKIKLSRFQYGRRNRKLQRDELVREKPYAFAFRYPLHSKYIDRSGSGDSEKLARFELPDLRTPDDIAQWLGMPLGRVAWLTHITERQFRPQSLSEAHYTFHWMPKKFGGARLIEAPKPLMRKVQHQILRGILDHVPAHDAAHGFVKHRSVLTNAAPHVGQRVVLRMDLENFYANIRFSRVAAIFRELGYSREAALWLARLCTSGLPPRMPLPEGRGANLVRNYTARHLPQGAPTSPALANFSAYSLDVRLTGLANSFHANYTRYADDLTFSGGDRFLRSLRVFIPLVNQIITQERFIAQPAKRRVIRDNQRQKVTGVVVNQKPNCDRREFDELKAILHNSVRFGPASQNRHDHEDFYAHLNGRIAHIAQLNPQRGEKLRSMFRQINWANSP